MMQEGIGIDRGYWLYPATTPGSTVTTPMGYGKLVGNQGRKQHLKSGGHATHVIFPIHSADQSGGALRLYTTASRGGGEGGGLNACGTKIFFRQSAGGQV